MASPESAAGPHPTAPKPAPAKPLTDLDFRSGARIQELNQLIQEHEARRNPAGRRDAPEELHQAKDKVFSLLGKTGLSNMGAKPPACLPASPHKASFSPPPSPPPRPLVSFFCSPAKHMEGSRWEREEGGGERGIEKKRDSPTPGEEGGTQRPVWQTGSFCRNMRNGLKANILGALQKLSSIGFFQ